jgi:hypothetical protein
MSPGVDPTRRLAGMSGPAVSTGQRLGTCHDCEGVGDSAGARRTAARACSTKALTQAEHVAAHTDRADDPQWIEYLCSPFGHLLASGQKLVEYLDDRGRVIDLHIGDTGNRAPW